MKDRDTDFYKPSGSKDENVKDFEAARRIGSKKKANSHEIAQLYDNIDCMQRAQAETRGQIQMAQAETRSQIEEMKREFRKWMMRVAA